MELGRHGCAEGHVAQVPPRVRRGQDRDEGTPAPPGGGVERGAVLPPNRRGPPRRPPPPPGASGAPPPPRSPRRAPPRSLTGPPRPAEIPAARHSSTWRSIGQVA